MKTKLCKRCHVRKSIIDFPISRKGKNNQTIFRSECKSCKRIYDHLCYEKRIGRPASLMPRINYKVSDKHLVSALKSQSSIAAALRSVSLKPDSGGAYVRCRRLIAEYHIDTSHFKGHGWNKGKTLPPRRPIEDYLSGQTRISSHKLRLRLLKEGLKKHQCESCQRTSWLDAPIPLELHHIDGNRENNRLDNLQILCPNCHSIQ